METIKWCCFCLLGPCHKNLRTPYSRLGITETLSKTFEECFQMQLTLGNEDECGICDSCEARLQDASDFKQQVQRSQAELRVRLERRARVAGGETPMKSEIGDDGAEAILLEPAVELEAVDDVAANDEAPLLAWHDAAPLSDVTEQVETCSTLERKEMHNKNTEPKPYRCQTCNKRFTLKCNLKVHIRIHTGQTKKPYSCELCKKQFTRKSHVVRHMKSHREREPLKCQVCNEEFTRKGDLDEHIKSHLGQKPFKCKICDKHFTMRGNLKVHMKNHTGQIEKPYSCHVCSKQFARKSNLERHVNIHTGLKPYSCEICDKRFKEKGHLNDHVRFHIGQTFYNCEVCNKGFIQQTDLKRHVSVHTGEKPYSCEVCHRQFRERGNMNKHMRIHTQPKTEKNM